MRRITFFAFTIILFFLGLVQAGQELYQHPPQEILDILNAPTIPIPAISPNGQSMILATPRKYPPISDLAEPQLRLAGVRVNPRNNAIHNAFYFVSYSLMKIPNGSEFQIALPSGARVSYPMWNATGSMFAFSNTTQSEVQ